MSCSDYDELYQALTDFSEPVDAVMCPFTSSMGLGVETALFALVVFGALGMGLSIRVQHPGPLVPAAMLSASVIASPLPGGAVSVFAFLLIAVISAMGIYVYSRARTEL